MERTSGEWLSAVKEKDVDDEMSVERGVLKKEVYQMCQSQKGKDGSSHAFRSEEQGIGIGMGVWVYKIGSTYVWLGSGMAHGVC